MTDDREAQKDFWSMEGNYIYRLHGEPRVQLYVLADESFPIPLRYSDVIRRTHKTLDMLQQSWMDDYWNVDGDRNLSEPWTDFMCNLRGIYFIDPNDIEFKETI